VVQNTVPWRVTPNCPNRRADLKKSVNFIRLGMPRKELRGPQGLDTPPGSMESSFAAMMKSLR
jgi:hypothetical protein